jgi:hypothetical protein
MNDTKTINQIIKENKGLWLQPEEVVDTLPLQMKSLKEYMLALGYLWSKEVDWGQHQKSNFFSISYENKGRVEVAFTTACRLHNSETDSLGSHQRKSLHFSPYAMRKAQAAKIVDTVSLQLNKKTGYISCNSNLVTFTHPEYEEMLKTVKYL